MYIKGFVLITCIVLNNAISVNNGSYEDIYVVIQDTVPESDTLLTRIQEIFTDASPKLFKATDSKIYFGQIKIVIPKTWTSKTDYTAIPELSPLDTYIHVDNGETTVPHVKRNIVECGSPGKYMYLHTDFLLETGLTDWGPHHNVIMHEWGHLRWGLFEEYPMGAMSSFYQEDGTWKPVRCTDKIRGDVSLGETCEPPTLSDKCDLTDSASTLDNACRFCPDTKRFVSASLMGFQFIEKMWTFCDKDDVQTPQDRRHNSRTGTQQNLFCDRRSAWEVMRTHSDFQSAEQLPDSTDTTPNFVIMQDTVKYQVFVLDVSGSMADFDRLDNMYRTGQYMIQTVLQLDSWLGIVTFSSGALDVINITQIKSQTDRDTLKNALPTSVAGSTCIGCGIENACAMLERKLENAEGGIVYLISDGMNNRRVAELDDIIQAAVDKKVVVHTIAISQSADSVLEEISVVTGGKHFSYLEVENGSSSLAASFASAASGGATSFNSAAVTLVSETSRLDADNTLTFSFNVDEGLGGNTTVSILTSQSVDISVIVTGPDGQSFKHEDISTQYIYVSIPGTAVEGEYRVSINMSSAPKSVEYYVTSFPTSGHPLQIFSRLSSSKLNLSLPELPKVYADVVKGGAPVLNVSVSAQIETANGTCSIDLKDNGIDPDQVRNDGSYSGYIQRACLANGRINVKVYANGQAGSTQLLLNPKGAFSLNGAVDKIDTLNSSFQRVSLSEDLTVSNYLANTADITPPNRITDVDVIDIRTELTGTGESRNFSITWTTPGDDFSIGQAAEYEFRVSDDIDTLANNFSFANLLDVVNTNFTPGMPGEQESLTLIIDADNSFTSTTYFAIAAKDEAGNVGRVSNIISIVVASGYRIKAAEYVYSPRPTPVKWAPKSTSKTLLIVISSTCAVVVLIALAIVRTVMLKLRTKKSDGDGDDRVNMKNMYHCCWPIRRERTPEGDYDLPDRGIRGRPQRRSRY